MIGDDNFLGFDLKLYALPGDDYGEAVVTYRNRQIARLPVSAIEQDELERVVGRLALKAARGLLPR